MNPVGRLVSPVALVVAGVALFLLEGCLTAPHDATVRRYLKAVRDSAAPELAQSLASLFAPNAVSLEFKHTELLRDGSTRVTAGVIWYSEGRLFVEYTQVPTGEERRNFGTFAGEFIGWKPGDTAAVSYKRYPGDTVEFLWYLIDPAGFKAAVYVAFLKNPGDFESLTVEGGRRLVLRQPLGEFDVRELVVLDSPLWLRDLMFRISNGPVAEVRMRVGPPRSLERLPPRLDEPPSDLSVTASETTIRSMMIFL